MRTKPAYEVKKGDIIEFRVNGNNHAFRASEDASPIDRTGSHVLLADSHHYVISVPALKPVTVVGERDEHYEEDHELRPACRLRARDAVYVPEWDEWAILKEVRMPPSKAGEPLIELQFALHGSITVPPGREMKVSRVVNMLTYVEKGMLETLKEMKEAGCPLAQKCIDLHDPYRYPGRTSWGARVLKEYAERALHLERHREAAEKRNAGNLVVYMEYDGVLRPVTVSVHRGMFPGIPNAADD